jgi:hypothetical protein
LASSHRKPGDVPVAVPAASAKEIEKIMRRAAELHWHGIEWTSITTFPAGFLPERATGTVSHTDDLRKPSRASTSFQDASSAG